jgi:hypothetical protein
LAKRKVHGKVSHQNGSPMNEITVTAFNKGVNQTIKLGEAKTNSIGHYMITYEGEGYINLLVMAGNVSNPKASNTKPYAGSNEEINLIVKPAHI